MTRNGRRCLVLAAGIALLGAWGFEAEARYYAQCGGTRGATCGAVGESCTWTDANGNTRTGTVVGGVSWNWCLLPGAAGDTGGTEAGPQSQAPTAAAPDPSPAPADRAPRGPMRRY